MFEYGVLWNNIILKYGTFGSSSHYGRQIVVASVLFLSCLINEVKGGQKIIDLFSGVKPNLRRSIQHGLEGESVYPSIELLTIYSTKRKYPCKRLFEQIGFWVW